MPPCVAALFGLGLGIPTLRLKDDYLAIVTLGFGVIIDIVLLNLDITGGPDGLARISSPKFWGVNFRNKVWYLLLVAFFVVLHPIVDLPPGEFPARPGPESHPGP